MRHRERGFALPIVLLLLILASAGSALIVTRVSTTQAGPAVNPISTRRARLAGHTIAWR